MAATDVMGEALPAEFLSMAETLADAAEPIVMTYFQSGVGADDKADASPVTVADREAEAALRQLIEDAYPDHGIYGEEYGQKNVDAEWVWVLDPIDGTVGFVTGKPLFGTLISLCHNGQPVLGVIAAPAAADRWIGAKGYPTTRNGDVVTARPCGDIADAWVYATTPDMFEGDDADAFQRLSGAVKRLWRGLLCLWPAGVWPC